MDTGCGLFILLLIVVVIVLVIANSSEKANAREAYLQSLEDLKRDPANPELRGATLRLGRVYAAKVRKSGQVGLFDEVALMNDINAACAAASLTPPQPVTSSSSSIEERLSRLGELKAKGLIDVREYAQRRQQILDEV
jgi:hypothetical protein